MQEINDIKGIMLWTPINIINTIIFIVFIVWLYILWSYLIKNKKVVKVKEKESNLQKTFNIDIYKEKLEQLENNINISSQVFYKQLAEVLKDILEYYWAKNISKMTFNEIKKLKLKQNLKDLIRNIYFKEYAKKIEDNEKIRKQLILDVKGLIK